MRILIVAGMAYALGACAANQTELPVNDVPPVEANKAGAVDRCEPNSLRDVLELVQDDRSIDSASYRHFGRRHAELAPFLPLIGRCYKATPTADSAEQLADIQHWSLALGGAAIKIEHALEDGSYGGVSFVYPQADSDAFTYVYITNAGFHTQGTIVLKDDQTFTASETVDGHPTITEVRSISRFDKTGLLSMASEFLDNGEWKPGPSFTHAVTNQPFPRLQLPGVADQD